MPPPSAVFRWLYEYIQHNLADFNEFAQYVGGFLARLEEPDADAAR